MTDNNLSKRPIQGNIAHAVRARACSQHLIPPGAAIMMHKDANNGGLGADDEDALPTSVCPPALLLFWRPESN